MYTLNNIPYEYNPQGFSDLSRKFYREEPKDVDGVFNSSAMFYRDSLYRTLYSIFKFKIPETWDENYFLQTLFQCGYIGITDTTMGVLALMCGYTGVNVFNKPTTILFTNYVLGNFERTIGKDGILVQLQNNFLSAQPIIDKYATLLAMCDSGVAVNLMNSKVAFIGLAESKNMAESLKKIYDDISAGKPAVFYKKTENIEFFFNDVKRTFVADQIQSLKRTIMNEFLTEIGINNANYDKRERLVTDEVNANNQQLEAMVTHWYDNIKKGFEQANKMFPSLNLSVKWRFEPDEPVEHTGLESGRVEGDRPSGRDVGSSDGTGDTP